LFQILGEEKQNYFSRNVFILLYLKFEIDDYNELESVILEDSLKQKAEISYHVSLHHADKKPFLAINN